MVEGFRLRVFLGVARGLGNSEAATVSLEAMVLQFRVSRVLLILQSFVHLQIRVKDFWTFCLRSLSSSGNMISLGGTQAPAPFQAKETSCGFAHQEAR